MAVVGDLKVMGFEEFFHEARLVVGPSAHTEAGSFERGSVGVESSLFGGLAETFPHYPEEFGAAFGCPDMVAGTGGGPADDLPVMIADDGSGRRLASVDSEKELAH